MQGEALLKIGGILEKLSNDINILKHNSIKSNYKSNSSTPKVRSKSVDHKRNKRPILRSTSQKRRISLKKKPHKKNSTKKNNKKR